MTGQISYQDLLTRLIKQEVAILGPSVILSQARGINGLQVEKDGRVKALMGEPQQILAELIKRYLVLSAPITQQILNSLSLDYPELKI